MRYDIVIIGAGPAGLTAAIYARRAGKSVLVLEKDSFGGQITFSPKLENYPGFESVSGNELAQRMLEQALGLGADVEMDTVTGLENGPVKTVIGEMARYEGRAVIIAAGARHRRLGLPREEEFIGNGLSFCAVCDGAFYQDGHAAVIGGGNTALQEIVLLSETCRKVTVVQNLAFLTGEQKMVDLVLSRPNVEILYSTVCVGYLGEAALTGLRLQNTLSGAETELAVDGAFLAIGTEPENLAYAALAPLNEAGYIKADESCTTPTPGIFAAGDCRTKAWRQVATAVADGAAAALNACRYLDR
ncbi:MAG: FAD-dependent oxidoreductase [Oscillospiraceae bacterium]|nr:FAD-dependent oxidoreductase [Oscillospiraceae bacterium]MBQ6159703.1 FAD-dependent oxidoreductase [Oscillospiraceae bacterium]